MVAIIGCFMCNPENEVCFAQFGEHTNLTGVRIVDGGLAMLMLDDGSEELLTEAIDERILKPLHAHTEILIAHVGDEGVLVTEYTVPLFNS